jgi:hypothetical protein
MVDFVRLQAIIIRSWVFAKRDNCKKPDLALAFYGVPGKM